MDLSREDKILFGVGIASALAITTLALVLSRGKPKPRKKSYGLKVGPQCSTYEYTDETRAKETIIKAVGEAAERGAIDPFAVASAWLRAAAGKCKSYPEQTRNPGEASLYRGAFLNVLQAMREKSLLSQDMDDAYHEMIDTWASAQGVDLGIA